MDRKIAKLFGCVVLVLLLCIPQKMGILAAVQEEQGEKEEAYSEEEKEETEDEEAEKEETEDEETEEEGAQEDEPDSPVLPFEVEIPPPDGKQNYYVSIPAIRIVHPGESSVTKYCVTDGNGRRTEGCLADAGDCVVFGREVLSEGKNHLRIWMEDASGEQLEEFVLDQELWIDTIAPVIQLKTQNGFSYWYSEYADLQVHIPEDASGSSVASVQCSADGEPAGESKENSCTFRIRHCSKEGSGVPVTVTAEDLAGNRSQVSAVLYIDGSAPAVSLEGCPDSGITGKPLEIRCTAVDENLLNHLEGNVEWEDVDGRLTRTQVTDWQDTAGGKQAVIPLMEDGIYKIRLTAADGAGHTAVTEDRVLIDTKSPEIRFVEALQGKYLSRFYWNLRTEELILDRTSVAYVIHLDGELYTMGTLVEREGQHVLEIHAVDAAGNQASARAEFVIDHTAPEVEFENLEDGAEYRETHTFRVRLANPADRIQKITINGTKQRLLGTEGIYSFTVEDEQNYEVVVLASDLAGNQTEKQIRFRVLPKETLAEKVIRPLARTMGLEKGVDAASASEETCEPGNVNRTAGVFPGIMIASGIAAVILLIVIRKKMSS